MKETHRRRWIWWVIALALLGGVVVLVLIASRSVPFTLLSTYGKDVLWQEGRVMNDCAECHNSSDFHTCDTCHDDHGSLELANIRFFEVVDLTGDVPDPTFVRVNQVMPDQENAGTHILLYDFLALYGVDDFESITFITNDGGIATVESRYLDETAMLVPYVDGVRFVTESVHSSTWLKGINRIVIVGTATPLDIDGTPTSIGRLLVGDTVRITVEGSDTMLADDTGEMTHALVANWAEGALLAPLLNHASPEFITVTDLAGNTIELSGAEIEGAVIAIVRDAVTLILPDRGRSVWPENIVKIESH